MRTLLEMQSLGRSFELRAPPLTSRQALVRRVLVQRIRSFSTSSSSKRKSSRLPGVIREIDMRGRRGVDAQSCADDAEANADRHAVELETERDHAGVAIWRRVTVAIEQLTDLTGTLH